MENNENNSNAGAISFANMLKEDLLKDEKKAELGFKISLLQFAIYLLTYLSVYISLDVFLFFTKMIFLLPIVAWAFGGFRRLWDGLLNITKKAYWLIPIMPINLFIAVIVLAYTIGFFIIVPSLFFWKMRRNIRRELQEIENRIKDLENPIQEEMHKEAKENEWLLK